MRPGGKAPGGRQRARMAAARSLGSSESMDGCCQTASALLRLLPCSEALAPAPSVTAWEMRALPIRNQGSHICPYDLSRTHPQQRLLAGGASLSFQSRRLDVSGKWIYFPLFMLVKPQKWMEKCINPEPAVKGAHLSLFVVMTASPVPARPLSLKLQCLLPQSLLKHSPYLITYVLRQHQ